MRPSILKVEYNDEKTKVEALRKLHAPQVASLTIDEEAKMVIVTGNADPVTATNKLRKLCGVNLIYHDPVTVEWDWSRHTLLKIIQ